MQVTEGRWAGAKGLGSATENLCGVGEPPGPRGVNHRVSGCICEENDDIEDRKKEQLPHHVN